MGTAVQSIVEKIKQEIANVRSTIAPPSGRTISTSGKLFALPTGQTSSGPIQAVILDYRNYNRYYKTAYNKMNPVPPSCFAIAKHHKDLAPHDEAEDPQSDDCASCPHNQWESAAQGRGKACSNLVRLALVAPDAPANAEAMFLNATPTALKSWAHLITTLEASGMLPVQVITEISFDPNVDYPKVQFQVLERHKNLEHFWALRERIQPVLDAPMA